MEINGSWQCSQMPDTGLVYPEPESSILLTHVIFIQGKGVPLHAMEEHGGRGGIAPTHT
jgi:hypothetical protein